MQYEGKLYGNMGRKYFNTGRTTEDWDRMEGALRRISIWAACDHMSRETRDKAMADINKAASEALVPTVEVSRRAIETQESNDNANQE